MSDRNTTPLLEPMDGPLLVELGNWLAESLDVSELSKEQALFVFMLVERLSNALWREFASTLLPLVMRNLGDLDADDPDESDEDPDG